MEMDRDFDGRFQPSDQMIGIERREQSRHVLDTERVGAQIFELLGHGDEPVDVVDGADGITDASLPHVCRRP